MITTRGTVLVGTAVFIYLFARITQVGWLYLLDAILWGALLVSLLLPWLAVMSLSAHRRMVRREGSLTSVGPTEGEVVQVELRLKNGTAWPRYLLSVSYDCPLASPEEQRQRTFVHLLNRRDSTVTRSAVLCHRRGLHRFGPVNVESQAPFGLFRRRKRLPSPLTVLVYPLVHPLGRLPLLEGMEGMAARPRRTRTGQEIAGSRRYFPGDTLRHIHWRNTARLGRPMVKEFEDTQENTLVIAFDSSKDSEDGPQSVLEYSIKLAASVARYVMERGGMVRLLTGRLPGVEMPWEALLQELALLEAGQGPGLPDLVDSLPAESRVLALVAEEDYRGIEALIRRAGQVSGMAVVVLGGICEFLPQGTERQMETLRRAGVPVVRCRRGELLEALRSLERLEWSSLAGNVSNLGDATKAGR